MDALIRKRIAKGLVIPASPLALDRNRKLDVRRQRALWRYYVAAGSGGIAVGVHTTQFAIRDPKIGLFEPLLSLAAEEFDHAHVRNPTGEPLVRIAGICGKTPQACVEAHLARKHRFHAGLLSLGAMRHATEEEMVHHCKEVAIVLPIIGFYLQPAVGGRTLSYNFWRRFLDIANVVAIKVAPFNRYQTLDVVRALAESGRNDVALYTGNDDNIVLDLVTPYRFSCHGKLVERRFVGGLLGHWSVWTHKAVELLDRCHQAVAAGTFGPDLLRLAIQVTDANAAFFDAVNGFAGCIAGLHEVLRRQGLLEGTWCLDEKEALGPGQMEEIERVLHAYPHLSDDDFVARHRDQWMRG